MIKFEISSEKFQGIIYLSYCENTGILMHYKNEAVMNFVQLQYFAQKFPSCVDDLITLKGNSKTLIITDVADVTPFEKFIEAYKPQSGDRQIAETLWLEMPETERKKVIKYIPKYRLNLQQTGIIQLKMENFLLQKRWNV